MLVGEKADGVDRNQPAISLRRNQQPASYFSLSPTNRLRSPNLRTAFPYQVPWYRGTTHKGNSWGKKGKGEGGASHNHSTPTPDRRQRELAGCAALPSAGAVTRYPFPNLFLLIPSASFCLLPWRGPFGGRRGSLDGARTRAHPRPRTYPGDSMWAWRLSNARGLCEPFRSLFSFVFVVCCYIGYLGCGLVRLSTASFGTWVELHEEGFGR